MRRYSLKIVQQTENEIQNEDIQQAKILRISHPKLLDGKYYEIINTHGTKVDAKCKTCGRVRKGDLRSTGNFMDHYRTQHPSMRDEVEQYRKQKEQMIPTDSLKQTTLTSLTSTLSTQLVSCSSSEEFRK